MLLVGVPLLDLLHRALTATYRLRRLGASYFERRAAGEDVRCIYVCWHEMLWHCMHRIRAQDATVIISTHRDGEFVSRVAERQGFRLARGSSTREGARGMRELIRAGRDPDTDLAIAVDGPKGPRRELKPGVLLLAQLTDRPIVPVMVAASPCWRFRSWDRFILGKPFTRVAIAMGEEVRVPRGVDRETLEAEHLPRLAVSMAQAERRCREALGLTPEDDGGA